jgi:hypothetical protein
MANTRNRVAVNNAENNGENNSCVATNNGEIRCCGLSKVWNGGDGRNPLGDVVFYAQMCYGLCHRSRHPKTTGAAMCPVWNNLLTN